MKLKDESSEFLVFVFKFLCLFAALYAGTYLYIGVVAPGGIYAPFLDKYFNYVRWLRLSLLNGSQFFLSFLDVPTVFNENGYLGIVKGRWVLVAYDCLGYGIISFWLAYIFSIKTRLQSRLIRLIVGVFILWFINVLRISLFLLAINRGWSLPLGIDHHTWFNIFSYMAIFLMIFIFERADRNAEPKQGNRSELSSK